MGWAKLALISWLGPIVTNTIRRQRIYLFTALDSLDWLAHPGSVGRALNGHPAHPR